MQEVFQVTAQGLQAPHLQACERGFHYGDGFFTTALVVEGAILNWSAHLRRLRNSAQRLGFAATLAQIETLSQQIAQAYQQLASVEAAMVLKIMIARGCGGRGYAPPLCENATILLQWSSAPFHWSMNAVTHAPMASMICQTPISISPALAGIKHFNRLENVLARAELDSLGLSEGVMLDVHQHCICGTQSNLVLIEGDALVTPSLHKSGVEGTSRYALSQWAQAFGYQWQETEIDLKRLQQADELFFINAVRGIQPVAKLEDRVFATEQGMSLQSLWWPQMQRAALKLGECP